jgi:hypothetical protein
MATFCAQRFVLGLEGISLVRRQMNDIGILDIVDIQLGVDLDCPQNLQHLYSSAWQVAQVEMRARGASSQFLSSCDLI